MLEKKQYFLFHARLNPLDEAIWAHLWSRLTRCSASSKLRLCLSNCLPTSPLKYILSFSHTHLLVHILWEKMCTNYAHLCASSNVWSGNLDRWALLWMCQLDKSSVTLYWQRCQDQVRRKKRGPTLTSPGLFYVCTRAEVFAVRKMLRCFEEESCILSHRRLTPWQTAASNFEETMFRVVIYHVLDLVMYMVIYSTSLSSSKHGAP